MLLKMEADSGYGNLASSLVASETLPLLIPDSDSEQNHLKPMNRQELETAAGGSGWRKFRSRLVLLFWLGWLSMLGVAITVIVQSPRPVVGHLNWWQKDLFYRLQPALFLDVKSTGSGAISRMSKKLPYLKSLRVGVMILEGLFRPDVSLLNLTQIDQRIGNLSEVQQFITESHKAAHRRQKQAANNPMAYFLPTYFLPNNGLRVILDLCKIGNNNTEIYSNTSDYFQDSLRYWLEQGVSGFEICNADPVLTDETLKRWRDVVKEFGTDGNERIIMMREMRDSVPGLNVSDSAINSSLVELVSKSLIPASSHPLSSPVVAVAIESKLKTLHGQWLSWRVGGPVAWKLQKVVMVLMMTLPGTPVIGYGDEISQAPKQPHPMSSRALFHSLSRARFHEEALLYGTFTFLTFNTTSFGSTNSTATPPLAFLRSWGCVHFLVIFNLDSESCDFNWTMSLPQSGLIITSTGLDRSGPVNLQSITLRPHEAMVIKLFETDRDFEKEGNKWFQE